MEKGKVEFSSFLICYKFTGTVGNLLPFKLYNYCFSTPIVDHQLAFFKIRMDGGYNKSKIQELKTIK